MQTGRHFSLLKTKRQPCFFTANAPFSVYLPLAHAFSYFQDNKGSESEHINLKVLGQDNAVVQFKIKKHTPLRKLMNAYCDRAVSFLLPGGCSSDPVNIIDTDFCCDLFAGSVNASGSISIRRPSDQRERHANVAGNGGGRHDRGLPTADWRRRRTTPIGR